MSALFSFPSRRPQERNPYGAMSLYDMLKFQADEFCRISGMLTQVYAQIQSNVAPTDHSWSLIGQNVLTLKEYCLGLGLSSAVAQIDRITGYINSQPNLTLKTLSEMLIDLHTRILDELEARQIFMVPQERATYLKDTHFAPSVAQRFPEAIEDMEEAARCYAFERPTACVFHLMRVTEYAVNAIAEFLGITDHNPTWEPIIRKIDKELKANYKDRHYKGSQDFLANASTHLHAVKTAWRNKTMHVEKTNTMSHAKEIYDATCGLMRYMADSLPEKQAGNVQQIRIAGVQGE